MGLQVINFTHPNIREITKRERFFGLNFESWFIVFFASVPIMAYTFLYSILIAFVLICVFYVIEFFDEDISKIILSHLQLKTGEGNYYA